MKRVLIGVVLLAGLCVAAVAQAETVNEVNFQLKDVKPDGRFTVVFTSRTYDTNGAVPPLLIRQYFRAPAGAVMPKEFLSKKNAGHLCNVALLKRTKNADTCKSSLIGTGTAKVDVRLVVNPATGQPYVKDLIPYNLNFFLAKPEAPGAVFGFVIFAQPDLSSPIVNAAGIIRDTKVTLVANFFNDPTPDGRFGYRLEVPAGPIEGFRVSVAEVYVNNFGQSFTKKTVKCKKKRKGKCVKKSVKKKKLFWFTRPKCPPSKQFPFQAYYEYEGVATPQIKDITVPCPPNFGQ